MYVLRIVGAPGIPGGASTPDIGAWIESADFDAFGGRGTFHSTRDPRRAKRFASHADAHAFWQTQSTARPLRPDGKPNRPLTALSVTIDPEPT